MNLSVDTNRSTSVDGCGSPAGACHTVGNSVLKSPLNSNAPMKLPSTSENK